MIRIAPSALAVLLATVAIPVRAEVPAVLTDVPPVHSLVARVMQGVGEPDLLLPPGASPHDFALRPSDATRLSEADVVIWAGEALTPWLEEPLETLAPDTERLSLLTTDGWARLELREDVAFAEAHDGDGAHGHSHDVADADGHGGGHDASDGHANDHAHADEDHHELEGSQDDHGHAHEGLDPHAWLDPEVAAVWTGHIAAALIAADPANGEAYRANAKAARAELAALTEGIAARLAPLAGQRFVVPHDAYQYFETRFGLPASGAIALNDAATPGPARIADLRDRIAQEGIACVLTDPQTSDDWQVLLRDGTEARTAQVDPDGSNLDRGPDLYPAIVTGLADALEECLR